MQHETFQKTMPRGASVCGNAERAHQVSPASCLTNSSQASLISLASTSLMKEVLTILAVMESRS